MTQEDARAYLNYLLTLNLRQEEAFGPLALAFSLSLYQRKRNGAIGATS
jgi:hypothetical protein